MKLTGDEKIKKFIERGCSDRMDSEQTLRDTVIGGGLLETIGWNFDNGEWQPAVAVQIGSRTLHLDYLVGKGENKFVLEAKNSTNKLDRDDDVGELLSYMKLTGSPYGILYNGKELLAFKLGSNLPFIEWSCGKGLGIFSMFSNENFPNSLEGFIKSQGSLARFQNYVKENTENIKRKIIDLVATDSQTSREIVDQYFPFLVSLFSAEREPQDSPTNRGFESYKLGVPIGSYDKTVPEIYRSDLRNLPRGTVLVCPVQDTEESDWGLNFLKKYNLWESVTISKNKKDTIRYIAFYVTWPESKILYFAEVSRIVDVSDAEFRKKHGLPPPDPEVMGKKSIELKPGSFKKLSDPITSVRGRGGGIRSHMYVEIEKFIRANTVRDLTSGGRQFE